MHTPNSTTKQTPPGKFIYGTLMAILMVYGMETYNTGLRHGWLHLSTFLFPLGEFFALTLCVVILQAYAGAPLAARLGTVLQRRIRKPIPRSLLMPLSMVLVMCPLMSLVATLCFQKIDHSLLLNWLRTLAINLPMALIWQFLCAGPLTRFVCRSVFKPVVT